MIGYANSADFIASYPKFVQEFPLRPFVLVAGEANQRSVAIMRRSQQELLEALRDLASKNESRQRIGTSLLAVFGSWLLALRAF